MDAKIVKAVMLGHAVADALGVPVEFCSRVELEKNPVTDMRGFGTYPYPAGSWSDDTSMSLCSLELLAKGYCDLDEIMINFGKWYYNDEFTPTGEMFDVGNTCSQAIDNYFAEHKEVPDCGVSGEYANGNGSLMRIHPIVLYCLAKDGRLTMDGILKIFTASNMTHYHARSAIGCGIYAFLLQALIGLPSKASIRLGLSKAKNYFECEPQLNHYSRLFDANFASLPEDEITSGGYVVHTLEAAIWCLLNTSTYEECVLKAVNLGDDTDTVAAVAGGLAGALYGYDAIPKEWLDLLKRRDYIEEMCERASSKWNELSKGFTMTDLHMHIVPDIDDGADDMESALEMLETAHKQGIRNIYCSSHSTYPIDEYNQNFRNLQNQAMTLYPDMRLYPSCEVYCSEEDIHQIIDNINSVKIHTVGDTKYVLVEFYPTEKVEVIKATIKRFVENGFVPIIAHAERCDRLNGKEVITELIDSGAYIQVNACSFAEETNMDVKLRARAMLQNRQIHFIGSDAHSPYHRPPQVEEGLRYIYSTVDKEYADCVVSGALLHIE